MMVGKSNFPFGKVTFFMGYVKNSGGHDVIPHITSPNGQWRRLVSRTEDQCTILMSCYIDLRDHSHLPALNWGGHISV